MKQTIDMRGVACPGPVVAVKKKTDDMIAGELLVLVDNQAAVQNLEKFAEYKGFTSSWEKSGEKEFAVQILVGQKALRDVDSYFDIYDRKQEEFVDGTHSAEQEMRPKKAEVKTRPEKETGEKTAPNISGSETAGPERWEREEEETAVCETCELVDAAAVLERIAEGQEFQPAPAAPQPAPAAPQPAAAAPQPAAPAAPQPAVAAPQPAAPAAPQPAPAPSQPAPAPGRSQQTAENPRSPLAKGTVLVISSDVMGSGDEGLGRLLMKGFLYAMVEQEKQPEMILFYNSGVFLTTEGSGVLDDLREMERRGVCLLTCGTCLNHYGRLEKLQVGEVTNMYEIAQCMMQAERIIRP